MWLLAYAFAGSLGSVGHASPLAEEVVCKKMADPNLASCNFKAPPNSSPTSIKVEVAGAQSKPQSVSAYPASGQKTAVLFLLDVSDPSRREAVRSNVSQIREILGRLKPHQQVGLAIFDSQYSLLAPVGSSRDKINAALNAVRAGGAATEFYKNIIAGTKTIRASNADRRVLVLFSDGKAEDSAYGREDAVKAIRSARITLIGLGFAESPSQVPALQTIERLSNETGGVFVKAGPGYKLPSEFMDAPFESAESGGTFILNTRYLYGDVKISVHMISQKKEIGALSGRLGANSGRSYLQNFIAFSSFYWMYLVIAAALISFGSVVIYRRRKRALAEGHSAIEFGYLEELDGKGTIYPLNRKAVRLGRGDDSDIRLSNSSVSRNHAELHHRDDGWHLVDLGSTNGLRINDTVVSNGLLKSNDIIEIGEVRFRFIEY